MIVRSFVRVEILTSFTAASRIGNRHLGDNSRIITKAYRQRSSEIPSDICNVTNSCTGELKYEDYWNEYPSPSLTGIQENRYLERCEMDIKRFYAIEIIAEDLQPYPSEKWARFGVGKLSEWRSTCELRNVTIRLYLSLICSLCGRSFYQLSAIICDSFVVCYRHPLSRRLSQPSFS